MPDLAHLFANNRAWADRMTRAQPNFFDRLLGQQAPRYLWIGCSDSRVPANEIVGLLDGLLQDLRNCPERAGQWPAISRGARRQTSRRGSYSGLMFTLRSAAPNAADSACNPAP